MKKTIQIAFITALTLLTTACTGKHKDQALYDEYHETMCFISKIPEMMKGEITPEISSKIQISSKRNTELAGELMKLPKDSEHASMFKQSLDMGTCGQSNSVKTSQSQPATNVQPQTALTPASAKSGSHTVGEVVQGDGFTVVLNDAQFTGSILKANFTIENKGTKEMHLSELLNFEAKNGEGSKLKQEIIGCSSSKASGAVLPSDKLKGDVCWDGATAPLKIYFKPELFSGTTTVWEVKESGSSQTSAAPAAAPAPTNTGRNSVGDVVQGDGFTVVLNNAQFSGSQLKANFTVENKEAKEMHISSVLSFEAKTADGSKLQQDIFGCSSSRLDGSVMSGDKLKGDICYKNAEAPVKIYFKPKVLGGTTTVFEVLK